MELLLAEVEPEWGAYRGRSGKLQSCLGNTSRHPFVVLVLEACLAFFAGDELEQQQR